MADFKPAFQKTAGHEGGYANDPDDTGKETYAGISRKWHPHWGGWAIVDAYKPLRHNQRINNPKLEAAIEQFYKEKYWDVLNADEIEDQAIAERLFDFGVNAGYSRSIRQIQSALGIPVTGKPDETTIDAINNPAKYLS